MDNIEVAGMAVKIAVDDTDVPKTMAELSREMKIVQSEFQKASAQLGEFGKGTQGLKLQADSLTKQIEIQQQRVAKLREEHMKSAQEKGEDARQTQNLETRLNKAEAELAKMEGELKKTTAEIEKQSSALVKMSQSLDATGQKMKAFGQGMTEAGKALSMAITVPLTALAGLSLKAAIDFESAYAGIRKTVSASEAEFAMLEKGIRNMAKEIPAAATEIARVGEAAGQLGIENQNILSFTRTMVDLGVATDMSSDQAAMALARLANITNMSQVDFDRLGSTLVDLGNNFAATEGEISEMAMRVAGAGTQIKMTEADILGFSAALASVGIRAEAGGTAISKLMIEMASDVDMGGERLAEFARVAGMSINDFVKLFKEDAATAIITFLGGLGDLSEEGESAFKIIDELSLSEVRLRDTVLRSSSARELANRALVTANEAWKENTALTEEAEERYKTTASQLQIFKNRITDVGITLGQALLPAIHKLLDSLQPLIDRLAKSAEWFANLSNGSRTFVIVIASLAAALGPVLMILGQLTTGLASFLIVAGKISAGVAAAGGAVGVLSKAFAAAVAPVKALGSALLFLVTNPIGLAITAVAALTAGIVALVKWLGKDSVPAVQSFGEQAEISASRASGSFEKFRSDSKTSLDAATADAKVAGTQIGENVADGVSKGTGKAKDTAVNDMKEMFERMKSEVDRNTEALNKMGDAIVTALKKQYEEMEKEQTKALDKQIDAEKKASDERIKIYDREYAEKLKLIDDEMYLQVKALQDQIDAIDDQTAAEERALKEQEYQARLAELNKQLAAAETAEERERIQKDLNKTIADYERRQLLDQRKDQKDSLKAQIEAAKEAAKEKKEQLKQELEDQKEAEKEKLAAIQQGLNEEKEAVKAHFEELKKEENIRAEARLMMIEENNDDIIKLLETYNPKWQDAGQSFADSFKNGLNSENQSIADAVQQAIDIAPVIDEQVQALAELEEKLKEVEEAAKGSSSGIEGLSVDLGDTTESIDELVDSLDDLLPVMDKASDGAANFGEESIAAFIGLKDRATVQLNQLFWSSAEITEEMATELADTFAAMGNEITANMDESHAEQLQSLQSFFESTNELTDEEKEEMLSKLKAKQEEERQEVENGQQRVFEILSSALDDQRSLTQAEYDEINGIQRTFTSTAENVFKDYELEQKAILERMKADAKDVTAQQAAEVVRNSLEQKDKAIEAAEEQYESVLKEIIRQRDEVGSISAEQADKLIQEAKRQKDEAIQHAIDMHQNVVAEAQKQAVSHINKVNWETGEIRTKWGVFVENMKDVLGVMTVAFKEEWDKQWQDVKDTWDNIASFLESIDLEEIGSNIIKGLANGIKAAATFVWDAIMGISTGIADSLTGFFGIQSPSRLMKGYGLNIGEGLAIGMSDSLAGIQRQAYAMSQAALPNVASVGAPAYSAGGFGNSNTYHNDNRTITFNINPNNIRELNQVIDIVNNLRQTARARG